MKILIAADMEGVTGVVSWDHVDPKHPEYARFRRLMTQDVNAAVAGAFEGGADEVVIADGHNNGRNILIEELHPRARLNSGGAGPLSMVEGAGADVAGAMYVGYHACGGTPNAILDHTWSDTRVAKVWLNGTHVGESGLNAAVCGHFGIPVILVTGDQAVCAEVEALLGAVETVVVKRAAARFAAECLPPTVTHRMIAESAALAVRRLQSGDAPKPFQVSAPVTIAVEFNQSDMADRAVILPGARRTGRCVEATASDMVLAYQAFRTLVALART